MGRSAAKRRQEAARSQQNKIQQKREQNNRPLGSKATQNGKPVLWAGQDYGWQSPSSYNKLQKDGAFRVGAGFSRRVSQAIGDAVDSVPKPVLDFIVKGIKNSEADKQAFQEALSQTPAGRLYLEAKNQPNATEKAIEDISRGTNVDPLLIEGAISIVEIAAEGKVGERLITKGGQKLAQTAVKAVPKGARKAIKDGAVQAGTKLKNVVKDAPARVQEIARDVRGKGAKPLGTKGSVGAAGAPATRNAGDALSQADPLGGPRLGDQAADGVARIQSKQAPANTVRSRGQARPGDRQNAALNQREAQLRQAADQQRGVIADRNARGESYQDENLALIRDNLNNDDLAFRAERNRALDRRSREREFTTAQFRDQLAIRNGERPASSPIDERYGVTLNDNVAPVSPRRPNVTNPDSARRNGDQNVVIRGDRTPNTIPRRNVQEGLDQRANQGMENRLRERRAREQQARIRSNREGIEARNRIAGNPQRQRQVVERANREGPQRTSRRIQEGREARLAEQRNYLRGQAEAGAMDNIPIGRAQRDIALRRELMRDYAIGSGTGQTIETAPGLIPNRLTRNVGKTTANQSENLSRAQAKAGRTKALTAAQQRQTNSSLAAFAFENGTPAPTRGEGGQRLFTPENRARALMKKGQNVKTNDDGEFYVMAGGRKSYLAPEGYDTYEQGFRSINDDIGYLSRKEYNQRAADLRRKPLRQLSRQEEKLNRANVSNQQGSLMNYVDIDDTITASPTSASRAKLYGRQTKGVLAPDEYGQIGGRKVGPTTWENSRGQMIEFDPDLLREPLERMMKPTQRQLMGRRAGGNSQLAIKGKGASTKAEPNGSSQGQRTKPNNRTVRQREQQALENVSTFAKQNGMSIDEALRFLQLQAGN